MQRPKLKPQHYTLFLNIQCKINRMNGRTMFWNIFINVVDFRTYGLNITSEEVDAVLSDIDDEFQGLKYIWVDRKVYILDPVFI